MLFKTLITPLLFPPGGKNSWYFIKIMVNPTVFLPLGGDAALRSPKHRDFMGETDFEPPKGGKGGKIPMKGGQNSYEGGQKSDKNGD